MKIYIQNKKEKTQNWKLFWWGGGGGEVKRDS